MKYKPKPIATSGVKLPRGLRKLTEELAENNHDLWVGFKNAAAAKGCLNRIRELTSEDDRFHRWATSYLKTVTEMEEKN